MNNRFLLDPECENLSSNTALKFSTINALEKTALGLLIFFTVIYIPNIIGFASIATYVFIEEQTYTMEGQAIDVFVASCEMIGRTESRALPHVIYTFQVDEAYYSGRGIVYGRGDCTNLPAGTPLRATYLSNNPSVSRINTPPVEQTILICVFFSGLATVMTGALIFFLRHIIRYFRDQRRYQRLLQSAIFLKGEIVSAKGKTDNLLFNRYQIHITYQFQNPEGKILTRKQHKVRRDLRNAELPTAGTPITVLYADDDAVVML